mmetsp:Transcript_37292/g.57251  ORF Transcript_37292/g.57251 Transcript_37292/m.57251 type:complete len:508 (+) Transcript_37292:104-1627(+)
MCKPNVLADPSQKKRVIICGAGPGGILTALYLLRRNDYSSSKGIKYHVTLVDQRENYGKLNADEIIAHRSWMIGLSTTGVESICGIEGLWDEYLKDAVIPASEFNLHVGKKQIPVHGKQSDDDDDSKRGVIDRNHVVWALTKSAMTRYGDKKNAFTPMFETKCLYVDGESNRLLVRGKDKRDKYLEYDVLIGADGIRSVVRNAFVQNDRYFEFDISDSFATIKHLHIKRPEGVSNRAIHLLGDCLPGSIGAFGLPEKNGNMNLVVGSSNHNSRPEELNSDDPAAVADYFRKNWNCAELDDYDEVAKQWVSQGWSVTGQVHCNTYHSESMSALLLGDAAHATTPTTGMGMNTAFGDAAALNAMLDEHKDDWTVVLPTFSKERIKIGRALTDLSFYLFSMDQLQMILYVISFGIREKLHKFFPWITRSPQSLIGMGVPLDEVYNQANEIGVIQAIRSTNDRIRREYNEEKWGMVKPKKRQYLPFSYLSISAAALAVGIAFAYKKGVFSY